MTTLRCKCGQTFNVDSDKAGQIISTPCCNTRVRVPPVKPDAPSPQPERIQVKCDCGKIFAVARPTKAVEVACPGCKKRHRLGGPTEAPKPRRKSSPKYEENFDDLPVTESDDWSSESFPPSGKPARPRAKRTAPKSRLPRLGVLEDNFGTPLLLGAALVFLAVFTALGLYLFNQAKANLAMASASESWQAADGKILESGFTVRGVQIQKQAATISVRYEFTADGTTRTGETLSFEKQDSYSPAEAESKLKPFPPGASCTVYYDPQDPSRNVLIKGVQGSNQLMYWMGLAFILCGIVLSIDCGLGAVNASRFPPPEFPRS